MTTPAIIAPPANDVGEDASAQVAPNVFPHLIVGLVGYLGAGCSDIAERLKGHFKTKGYEARIISVSKLIARHLKLKLDRLPDETDGEYAFRRTHLLQDGGDQIREENNPASCMALALDEMAKIRAAAKGGERFVFLIDSMKHADEVEVLRRLYKGSFRLVSVFADRKKREARIIFDNKAKFHGVSPDKAIKLLDRDEMDGAKNSGQQVRKAFYLGDYFLNNNFDRLDATAIDTGLVRFINLLLGNSLHRPKQDERGIHAAFAASLKSACLSRQVGAVLVDPEGNVIAIGANEVPKFGGGTYDEDSDRPERRCFAWEYKSRDGTFTGCHKDRKNRLLEQQIRQWLSQQINQIDLSTSSASNDERVGVRQLISDYLRSSADVAEMPGVSDIIEYSRSIHAEMDALLAAARSGRCPVGATLYCTTYPCHNCARHLVAAGVHRVVYVEPYVKSQAIDLHEDSIAKFSDEAFNEKTKRQEKMIVEAFTGVGPRMYDYHFSKTVELKDANGVFVAPKGNDIPIAAIAVDSLEQTEQRFIRQLMPGGVHG